MDRTSANACKYTRRSNRNVCIRAAAAPNDPEPLRTRPQAAANFLARDSARNSDQHRGGGGIHGNCLLRPQIPPAAEPPIREAAANANAIHLMVAHAEKSRA